MSMSANCEDKYLGLIILKCLNDIKINCGRKLLSNILIGTKAIKDFELKQLNNKFFGILNDLTSIIVLKYITCLIQQGYLEVYNSQFMFKRPLLRLTEKGKKAILEKSEIIFEDKYLTMEFNINEYSYNQTLELFNKGKSIEEISKIRGLSENTIYDHFGAYIRDGIIKPEKIIDLDKRKRIMEVINSGEWITLTDIKKKVGEDVKFGEIACMFIFIKKYPDFVNEIKRKKDEYISKNPYVALENSSEMINKKYFNSFKQWNKEEQEKLKQLYKENKSLTKIALILGRTPNEIRKISRELDLYQ